jgi:membrane protein DedA with SNARE-associated domain
MKQLALDWIAQYGYAAIFFLLTFGIVGVPVPDEVLLIFSGFLIFKGTLQFVPAVAAALAGSAAGMTISYALGRSFGPYLIEKYGPWFHLTKTRFEDIQGWFQRWGRWTLPLGYFLPVVRHLTAYMAGASRMRPGTFMIFAYGGALAWALTFVSAGYFLGEAWNRFSDRISGGGALIAGGLVTVIALTVVVRTFRQHQ